MKKFLLIVLLSLVSLTILGCENDSNDKVDEEIKEPTEKLLSCVKVGDEK